MSQGTLYTLDTLKSTFQGIGDFDERRLFDALTVYLEAHNRIMETLFLDLMDRTTDTDRLYGSADVMTMTKTDQFGLANAQKIGYGSKVGFPMESFTGTLQWTRKYMQTATVAEITAQFIALQAADRHRVVLEATRALFNPTDFTFNDYLANRRSVVPIQVRALVNADGEPIPPGPNGEIFDGTNHTHYLATASFIQADLTAALETVLEHFASGIAQIYINRGSEGTIKGFADFIVLPYPMVVQATTRDVYEEPKLSPIALYNRDIGMFHGALVSVRPWVPAGYVVVFIRGQEKPLAFRTRTPTSGNLTLEYEDDDFPLRCKVYEREFGIGVANRVAASVLYTGGGSYVAPTVAF